MSCIMLILERQGERTTEKVFLQSAQIIALAASLERNILVLVLHFDNLLLKVRCTITLIFSSGSRAICLSFALRALPCQ